MASICMRPLDRCPIRRERSPATREMASRSIAFLRESRAREIHPDWRCSRFRRGRRLAVGLTAPAHMAIPYPAGHRGDQRWRTRQASGREQSFRQRRSARCGDGEDSAELRSEHERSGAILIPVHVRSHERRPARLVQFVECIASGGTGSAQRESRAPDQAEAA